MLLVEDVGFQEVGVLVVFDCNFRLVLVWCVV